MTAATDHPSHFTDHGFARHHPARLAGLAPQLAVWVTLVILSGALLPLLATSGAVLDDRARSLLRLSVLPIYATTMILALRHAQAVARSILRSAPLLALVGLQFASVLWSISPSISLRRAVALAITLLLSHVLAVVFTPRQLLWLVASALGTCMLASLAMMGLSPSLAFVPDEGVLRGIYQNKNVLGWGAGIATVAGVILACDRGGDRRKAGAMIAVVSAACLVMSQSSTGLLAAAGALIVAGFLVLLGRARGLGRVLLLVGFMVAAGMTLIFLGLLLVPLLEALGKDATLTGRVPMWHLIDARIADRLWLGHGYQVFWTMGNQEAWVIWGQIGWLSPHAHSGYRDILLGTGLAGAALTAWTILRAVRGGARLSLLRSGQGWLWPSVFMAQILILNLTESTLLAQNDLQWTLMGTMIALTANHGRRT
ncbi:O-antigen ligase family protein [Paracoccus sp. R86501]|uniref:O-antigen ligase family protein n=1 Tax=Paracoccus sp. R86501 TaxID=3101711 RepID=UPI00366F7350